MSDPTTTIPDVNVTPSYPGTDGVSVTRRPRLQMTAQGVVLPSPIQAEVISVNTYHADRFNGVITYRDTDQANAAFWSNTNDIQISIAVGLVPDTSVNTVHRWVPLIEGTIDTLTVDPFDLTVRFSGRDYSSLLIDARINSAYPNQTSSQIVTALADAVGLQTQVTPTTTLVGRYFENDFNRNADGQFTRYVTAWDMCVDLAQHEGFDIFVFGPTLYFQPPASQAAGAPALDIFVKPGVVPVSNVTSMEMQRTLTLAKNVKVRVNSWNTATETRVTATATSAQVNGSNIGPVQTYVFERPNLTLHQAQELAKQRLAQITRHERVIEFEMPADPHFTPRGLVRLDGTGTGFDQIYFPDEITTTISWDGGFRQRVRAKNTSPATVSYTETAGP